MPRNYYGHFQDLKGLMNKQKHKTVSFKWNPHYPMVPNKS